MSGPRVRVLVGDLARTGVPIVLERLVRWAAASRPGHVDVVAIRGGALQSEFAALAASVTVLEPSGRRSAPDAVAAGFAELGHPGPGRALRDAAWRLRLRHLPPPDVVLMHGAAAWALVPTAPRSVPLVVHLHELQTGMNRSIPRAERPALYRRAHGIMAVCTQVADLARDDGAAAERLSIVPGVTGPPPATSGPARTDPSRAKPIVAGIGTPGWRKATDRFVAVAHELSRSHPDARCVWVGGSPPGGLAAAAGTVDPVTWVEPQPDPWAELADAAVLVVPSREDALPLVALEGAERGVPVVCANTGGLADLFADGRGLVAPSYDVAALHAAVADTLDDRPAARTRANAAAAHVAHHYSVSQIGPLWWSTLTDAVRSHGGSGGQR